MPNTISISVTAIHVRVDMRNLPEILRSQTLNFKIFPPEVALVQWLKNLPWFFQADRSMDLKLVDMAVISE
jgi:hypothetical protein